MYNEWCRTLQKDISLSFKVGLPPSKKLCYLLDWKPFKNGEKCFLFHLKSFFRSKDVYVFVTTFWPCRKNSLIIRWISKFMTSQPGLKQLQYTYCPISHKVKANQTMKFGQIIEYNKKNSFLQNLYRKWDKKTSFRPLYFLKKLNMRRKQVVGLQLSLNRFR